MDRELSQPAHHSEKSLQMAAGELEVVLFRDDFKPPGPRPCEAWPNLEVAKIPL